MYRRTANPNMIAIALRLMVAEDRKPRRSRKRPAKAPTFEHYHSKAPVTLPIVKWRGHVEDF